MALTCTLFLLCQEKRRRNLSKTYYWKAGRKKYTINNEQFFPTLVSVKKGHDEVVKQQIRLEKAKKLREFSWKYYRMQFSEDVTLEKILRSLNFRALLHHKNLAAQPKSHQNGEDNRVLCQEAKAKSQAPHRVDSMAYFLTRVHKRVHFLKVLTRIMKKTQN